jgi:hypothetical protein
MATNNDRATGQVVVAVQQVQRGTVGQEEAVNGHGGCSVFGEAVRRRHDFSRIGADLRLPVTVSAAKGSRHQAPAVLPGPCRIETAGSNHRSFGDSTQVDRHE